MIRWIERIEETQDPVFCPTEDGVRMEMVKGQQLVKVLQYWDGPAGWPIAAGQWIDVPTVSERESE